MRAVLFDAILERHVCEGLARALREGGHDVEWTGPLSTGHSLPQRGEESADLKHALERLSEDPPDLLINFRASGLRPERVHQLRARGVHSMVWFPDDPVLYEICYRHVVEAYDTVLHCGPESVLDFYARRHGVTGVSFPFWADSGAFPSSYDPERADVDLVFLGNCVGPGRTERYELLRSLPFQVRAFGRLERDPAGIHGGYLEGPEEIAGALSRARCGLSMPQVFAGYRGSPYDFPGLSELGAFEIPSRVIQYAAVGLPVLQVAAQAGSATFPELVALRDRDELVEQAALLLRDPEGLRELSARTHRRFRRSFSAASRALFLEWLHSERASWRGMSAAERARLFAEFPPSAYDDAVSAGSPSGKARTDAEAEAEAGKTTRSTMASRSNGSTLQEETPALARPVRYELPSIEEQREALRKTRFQSPVTWRILHFGAFANGENDIVASLKRALETLGHAVLHVDTKRTAEGLAAGIIDYTDGARGGHAPNFVNLHAIEGLLRRFRPQVIVCNAGGLCFRADDAAELKRRGILLVGLTLSDPDVFPTVSEHAGLFDFHVTNAREAVAMYERAGVTNTLHFPFGIDRDYVLAEVDEAPELGAEVICVGHALGTLDRRETMEALAERFAVRVYGRGWELPGAEVVTGDRQIQALRAGAVHVNFARTRANHMNVKCGVFESIACGGVVCTARFGEMESFFKYGTEIVGFETWEDLIPTAQELLQRPDRLEKMRRTAFATLIDNHLYEHRWLELFDRVHTELATPTILAPERTEQLRSLLAEQRPVRSVIVSGFYGGRNTGDELLLRAITEGVRAAQEDIEFAVAAHNPEQVRAAHDIPAFRRSDLEAADEAVSRASAVVLGGGGLWHDYTFDRGGGLPGLFGGSTLSVTGLGVIPLLARIRRRPFHVFGMGAGPLDNPDARQLVRYLGEQAETVSVRDERSREVLEGIDGWERPVRVAPDPVYSLDLSDRRVPDAVSEIHAGWPILAVNLRPWPRAEESGLYETVAEALQAVVRERDMALVGLAMQGGAGVDARVLAETFDRVESPAPKLILEWSPGFEELFGTLALCDGVLAMRLHACLLSHRLGTPAVGIHYDPKVRLHFAELGLDERSLPIDAQAKEFVGALEQMLDEGGRMDELTRQRTRELERLATEEIQHLASRLASAPEITGVTAATFAEQLALTKSR